MTVRVTGIVAGLALLAGCGSGEGGGSAARDDRLVCFVSIPPLAYFVERIGGAHTKVSVMVGPGQSPATYEPTPKQMAGLGGAVVYFAIGVPFEARILPQIERALPELEVVRTGPRPRTSGLPEAHGHGDGHDPHVWLSPRHAKDISHQIERTLARLDPARSETFAQNAIALQRDLDELEREVRDTLAPHRGKAIYVFHPAFAHLVSPSGIHQIAIERGGAAPGSRHVATVIDSARSGRARAIFVQPQFSSTSAKKVAAAIGAHVVTIDPLDRDYLSNMRRMTARIDEALRDARPQFSRPPVKKTEAL